MWIPVYGRIDAYLCSGVLTLIFVTYDQYWLVSFCYWAEKCAFVQSCYVWSHDDEKGEKVISVHNSLSLLQWLHNYFGSSISEQYFQIVTDRLASYSTRSDWGYVLSLILTIQSTSQYTSIDPSFSTKMVWFYSNIITIYAKNYQILRQNKVGIGWFSLYKNGVLKC